MCVYITIHYTYIELMMWASDLLFLCLLVPNQQKEIPACTRTLRYNVSFMIPTSACQFTIHRLYAVQCCKENSTKCLALFAIDRSTDISFSPTLLFNLSFDLSKNLIIRFLDGIKTTNDYYVCLAKHSVVA